MNARTSSRAWRQGQAPPCARAGRRPPVRSRRGRRRGAQGLGARAELLDQREAGLALLLAQDLAQQPPERVDVVAELVLALRLQLFHGRRPASAFRPLTLPPAAHSLRPMASPAPPKSSAASWPAAARPGGRTPSPGRAATTSGCSTCACATSGSRSRAAAWRPGSQELYRELAARGLRLPAALLALRRVVLPGRRARHRDPVLPGPPAPGPARAGADARGGGRDPGVVPEDPPPRDRPRHRERLPPAPPCPPPGAVRPDLAALPGVLLAAALQPELRAPPRRLVRAEPPRRGLRRDLRGVARPRTRTGAGATRGWPALRKLEYVDKRHGPDRGPRRRETSRARRSGAPLRACARRCARTTRQRRGHYGIDHPPFYDRDLLRLFSRAPEHARQPPGRGCPARAIRADACAPASPAGPGSTST